MLDTIQANEKVKSVVLISAKSDGFIAGADINMLAAAKDEKELEEVRGPRRRGAGGGVNPKRSQPTHLSPPPFLRA